MCLFDWGPLSGLSSNIEHPSSVLVDGERHVSAPSDQSRGSVNVVDHNGRSRFGGRVRLPPSQELTTNESLVAFGSSQTRTSSLGAARPLPPSADIGPGGQSVGSTSPNARRCTRSRLICRRRSSRISNCRTGWRARRGTGLTSRSRARCRTIARSTRMPAGTSGYFDTAEEAYIAYRLTKSSLCGGGFRMPDVDLAHQQQRRA